MIYDSIQLKKKNFIKNYLLTVANNSWLASTQYLCFSAKILAIEILTEKEIIAITKPLIATFGSRVKGGTEGVGNLQCHNT